MVAAEAEAAAAILGCVVQHRGAAARSMFRAHSGSLADVREEALAAEQRTSPRVQPRQRDPQLPLRPPRSGDHPRLPHRGPRPDARDLPHRPAQPRLSGSRRDGDRAPDGRCVRARDAHAADAFPPRFHRDSRRQLPYQAELGEPAGRDHPSVATPHRAGRRGDQPASSSQHIRDDQRAADEGAAPRTWEDRSPHRRRRQAPGAVPLLPHACRNCGVYLPDRRKRYCEECRTQRWTKHAGQGRDSAASVLATLRSEQRDPAHGGRAAEIRGRKNAQHQRAVRQWKGDRPDAAIFESEIQPGLRELPIQTLVASTGLSEHYCSLIRLGKRIPHARHWDTLRTVAERN
jgi:hypothetical protein